MVKIANFLKIPIGNMPKAPSKMHMYDMVKIDTIVFEIVGGGGLLKPPPWIVCCLKYPGSDRVKVPHGSLTNSFSKNLLFTVIV